MDPILLELVDRLILNSPLARNRPEEAALALEAQATRLIALANRIRHQGAQAMVDGGGVGDRCRIKVVGPKGEVLQDTGFFGSN